MILSDFNDVNLAQKYNIFAKHTIFYICYTTYSMPKINNICIFAKKIVYLRCFFNTYYYDNKRITAGF